METESPRQPRELIVTDRPSVDGPARSIIDGVMGTAILNPELASVLAFFYEQLNAALLNPNEMIEDFQEISFLSFHEAKHLVADYAREIQYFMTHSGLVLYSQLSESLGRRKPLEMPSPTSKYLTWKEVMDLKHREDICLIHGKMDPPTVGHASLAAQLYPSGSFTLLGFDPNALLEARGQGPKFKELAWRMANLAISPVVDGVFVMPLSTHPTPDDYLQIYRDIGVSTLGCEEGHPHLQEYERCMAELGGRVMTLPRPNSEYMSATNIYDFMGRNPFVQDEEKFRMFVSERDSALRENGVYLEDYPVTSTEDTFYDNLLLLWSIRLVRKCKEADGLSNETRLELIRLNGAHTLRESWFQFYLSMKSRSSASDL